MHILNKQGKVTVLANCIAANYIEDQSWQKA